MRSNLDENVSLSTPFFNCFFDFMRKKFQWGEKSLLLFPNIIVVVGGVLSAPQIYAFCNNNAMERRILGDGCVYSSGSINKKTHNIDFQ